MAAIDLLLCGELVGKRVLGQCPVLPSTAGGMMVCYIRTKFPGQLLRRSHSGIEAWRLQVNWTSCRGPRAGTETGLDLLWTGWCSHAPFAPRLWPSGARSSAIAAHQRPTLLSASSRLPGTILCGCSCFHPSRDHRSSCPPVWSSAISKFW